MGVLPPSTLCSRGCGRAYHATYGNEPLCLSCRRADVRPDSTLTDRSRSPRACGWPNKGGGSCKWDFDKCPHHTERVRTAWERPRMEGEDRRCKEPGCNELPPCRYHTENPKRCESMLDSAPLKRCSFDKAEGSCYCEKHQPFPNMGVSAAKYARLCDSVGLRYSEAQWVAWAYPEAREVPGVYDFTKYCCNMKQATE